MSENHSSLPSEVIDDMRYIDEVSEVYKSQDGRPAINNLFQRPVYLPS